MVTKGKDKQDERQTRVPFSRGFHFAKRSQNGSPQRYSEKGSPSLIPVIERAEQQLRMELKQVRHEASDQVTQAEKQAVQHLQESQLSISELVEQRRKGELAELQKQAEQISRSSDKRSAHLQQKAKKNMAQAVRRVVEAVIGSPYEVTAVGGQT